jgi:flavin-dependent dehydrogenase
MPAAKTAPAGHAVVIGGSMAGLLAARVLADHFDQVTVVDRDHLPEEPTPRKGVPQARHIHILLVRGQRILNRFFPNLADDMLAAGAAPVNWSLDAAMLLATGWSPRYESDLLSYVCSRDLLDWLVRCRLAQNQRVRFLPRRQATGLLSTAGGRRVTGVALRPVGGMAADESRLEADLVIDASGRASRLPQWLEALGYAPPTETVVNAYLGYASRWYERPAGFDGDWKAILLMARSPHLPRGGGILPAEGGRWLVTLAGYGSDHPPTDEAGFMAFAQRLAAPDIYDALRAARPLSSITGYQRTENRLRHYERLRRRPEGVIALGDAVCAFNPVYAQGMSVSGLAALALDTCLRQRSNHDATGLAGRFQRQLAQMNRIPWLLATGEDFRWPTTTGGRPDWTTRLAHRYVEQVLGLIPGDRRISQTFFEVTHLMRHPAALFRPAIAAQVVPRMAGKRPSLDM